MPLNMPHLTLHVTKSSTPLTQLISAVHSTQIHYKTKGCDKPIHMVQPFLGFEDSSLSTSSLYNNDSSSILDLVWKFFLQPRPIPDPYRSDGDLHADGSFVQVWPLSDLIFWFCVDFDSLIVIYSVFFVFL